MHNVRAMPKQTSPFLTSVQVAEILGVDRSTLSRHVAFGKIQPAMKLPGKRGAMLFDAATVRQYAKALKAAS